MAIAPKRRGANVPGVPPPSAAGRRGPAAEPKPEVAATLEPAGQSADGKILIACFVLGLLCRLVVFTGPHMEGDELVYASLVRQLMNGHGYNLIGATILGKPMVGADWPADQYGRALFFHPPGGIGFFWLLVKPFGGRGFGIAQVLSYALFFWSMIALARAVMPPLRGARLQFTAALAAFTPIMTHIVSRWWLDGPMLALSTLAAALFLGAVTRRDTRGALVAGLVMGCASWTKTAALVMVPGVLVLGWSVCEPPARGTAVRLGILFAGVAALVQLPWELWQWAVVGNPFPAWAGKPSPTLIAQNDYVRALTVVRPWWIYLTLTPRALWSLAPSIGCLALVRSDSRTRRIGVGLLLWIACVLGVVMALGATGYSKLLRYAVLVTPATVLLAGLAAGIVFDRRTDRRLSPGTRLVVEVLAILMAIGVILEVSQGFATPILNSKFDIIVPILWPMRSVP
jgi:hypothetical protein